MNATEMIQLTGECSHCGNNSIWSGHAWNCSHCFCDTVSIAQVEHVRVDARKGEEDTVSLTPTNKEDGLWLV